MVFIASQLLIVVLGLIVYAFDLHSHALIESLRQTAHPMLFYYLSGLFFSLALLGMWFTVLQMGCCGDSASGGCSAPNDCVCADGCIYPIYYTSPHAGVDCCGLECCACCGQGAGDAGAGGAAGCGDCAAGAGAGEECVMCLVVAVVLFALVGAVVCVVLGVAYAQKVVRSHYHVLQKLTLASDYIVADLAEGALSVGESTDVAAEEGPVEAAGAGYWSSPMHTAAGSGGQGGATATSTAYARLPSSVGDEEAGLALMEMRRLDTLPSAPPLSPMERDAPDLYQGASAPYDPQLHRFSRSQYAELATRGLL